MGWNRDISPLRGRRHCALGWNKDIAHKETGDILHWDSTETLHPYETGAMEYWEAMQRRDTAVLTIGRRWCPLEQNRGTRWETGNTVF